MPALQFKGKPLVQNHHLVVPFRELVPVRKSGLAKTPSLHDNLILEGDNLAALKALLPSHHGKVKCITIDPPYNTGNEGWIYNDKVNSPMIREWLGREVARDDLTRHDKWCCMMLPRLKLLRELLADDGAIFVSIDDNEVHHLRCLMDEVFGEENFVANVVWQARYSRSNDATFSLSHNHVVIYARNLPRWESGRNLLSRTESQEAQYTNPDNDPRGRWRAIPWDAPNVRENLSYPIKTPAGGVRFPPPGRCWSRTEAQWLRLVEEGLAYFGKNQDGAPSFKGFLDDAPKIVPNTWWNHEDAGHTDEAKKELLTIFKDRNVDQFSTPKPTRLIQRILQIATDPDSIILDSFAGSGTTAQAVLALNQEDGGSRRFVLCQMPYETREQEAAGENICERVTAERVRRVIRGVPGAKDEALRAGLGGTFSYFRLGKELRKQGLLDGKDLPTYEALAGYVFFTATGVEFDPRKIRKRSGLIGTDRDRDIFLLYADDMAKLKDLALTLEVARKIAATSARRKLVFAPTKYLDPEYLDRLKMEFCQLPFEIYQRGDR